LIRKENTDLSLARQCKLRKISQSSTYYTPVGLDHATIDLMREIDRIFTKYPFFGSRQITAYLPQSGFSAGRHRVHRLMGTMDLQPSTWVQIPARSIHSIRPGHIYCESCRLRDPIWFGATTSPTFQ